MRNKQNGALIMFEGKPMLIKPRKSRITNKNMGINKMEQWYYFEKK